jgi:hypothetical protein
VTEEISGLIERGTLAILCWRPVLPPANPLRTNGSREGIMGRRVLLRLLKLEFRFVRLKEIAEFLRRIERAHPLLVVERYGKTAKP